MLINESNETKIKQNGRYLDLVVLAPKGAHTHSQYSMHNFVFMPFLFASVGTVGPRALHRHSNHCLWPTRHAKLRVCPDSSAPDGSIEATMAWIQPRLSTHQSFVIGMMDRTTLTDLIESLRTVSTRQFLCKNISCVWPLLSCVLRESHSQQRQDIFLLHRLLEITKGGPGTFVEIGALNGISFSNTLMLERCFNWTGLLIEAEPLNAEALMQSNRTARKVHSAVCKANKSPSTLRITTGNGNVAHIVEESSKPQPNTVEVPCATLSQLMREAGIYCADFLSLDVEGAELLVLQTVNASIFKLVMVEEELLVSNANNIQAVRNILTESGLVEAHGMERVEYSEIDSNNLLHCMLSSFFCILADKVFVPRLPRGAQKRAL